jgi:hypothetical protein
LPGDAAGRLALLQKAGLIDHQHAIVVGERLALANPLLAKAKIKQPQLILAD